MHTFSRYKKFTRRLTLLLSAGAGFFLPFMAIGKVGFKETLGVSPFELMIVLASPFFIFNIVKNRRKLVGNRVALALCCVAASQIFAALVSGDIGLEAKTIGRNIGLMVCVLGLACEASIPERRCWIARGLLVGGSISVVVSIVGYLTVVWFFDSGQFIQPFVQSDSFLGLAWVHRLTGTHGHSPQHYGELLLVLAVVSSTEANVPRRGIWRLLARIALTLVAVAFVMTFSYAGALGFVFLLGLVYLWRLHSRRLQLLFVSFSVISVLGVVWVMNMGLPASPLPDVYGTEVTLDDIDIRRTFFFAEQEDGKETIHLQFNQWPVISPKTTYLHSKETAVELGLAHLPFGTGFAHYPGYVKQRLTDIHGTWNSNAYHTPHCTVLTAFATAGVPGLLAILFLTWAVLGRWPGLSTTDAKKKDQAVIWLGVVLFLVIGINIDIVENRSCWFLLALLIGVQMEGGGGAENPGEHGRYQSTISKKS